MPNYIKNRIQIIGTPEQIEQVLNRFSTNYEKEIRTSYDGDLVYKDKVTGEFGWLNQKTNEFKLRGRELPLTGVPDNFEPHYNEAWTRFPDFNKIIPRPESLDITSDNWIMPLENQFSFNTIFKDHVDKLKDVCSKCPDRKEEMVNNFLQGIRNYIDHGHATWLGWSRANWGTKWNSSDCDKVDENTFDFITAWNGVPELIEKISIEFPEIEFIYEFSDEDTGCNCGRGIFLHGNTSFHQPENCSKEAYDLAFKLRPDNAKYYTLVDGNYKYKEEEEE